MWSSIVKAKQLGAAHTWSWWTSKTVNRSRIAGHQQLTNAWARLWLAGYVVCTLLRQPVALLCEAALKWQTSEVLQKRLKCGDLLLLPDGNFLCFTLRLRNVQQRFSCDVTALPAHWLGGKDGWHQSSLQSTVQYGDRRQYYGGAMKLVGIGTVPRGDEAPWFPRGPLAFLADGGAVNLVGRCQVFLYWRDELWWRTVMWGPRGGMMWPAGCLRDS